MLALEDTTTFASIASILETATHLRSIYLDSCSTAAITPCSKNLLDQFTAISPARCKVFAAYQPGKGMVLERSIDSSFFARKFLARKDQSFLLSSNEDSIVLDIENLFIDL